MNKKYIITGAHGTGKTSIMNKLKERGFNCIDENSREIIAEQVDEITSEPNYETALSVLS